MDIKKSNTENSVVIDQYIVPWLQTQNKEHLPEAHFSPANGIPAASYKSFFQQFESVINISSMDSRGAWQQSPKPLEKFTFNDYANYLIIALESKYQEPIIGIGHSLGGIITILAANKRPKLFSKLILIDPASTPSPFANFIFQRMPRWLMLRCFPFVKGSLNRRQVWQSREQFYDNYRHHKTFSRFTDRALSDYAQHGLIERKDGLFELVFSPEWESFNFRKVSFLWDHLEKTTQPALLLRAEHNWLYSEQVFNKHNARLGNNITAKTLENTSHLMTHEQTDIVAKEIIAWLEK